MNDSIVVFDIETTGLNPTTNQVIEIGALKIEGGRVVEEFSKFINPFMKLPPKIVALTGIQDYMLKDAEVADRVIAEFLEFSDGHVLLGHNIMFDYSFIKVNADKIGKKFDRHGIDTLKIAKGVHPELESRSLEKMCRYYKINNVSAHRALSDAKATYELYYKMKEKFHELKADLFVPEQLNYKVKKQEPITIRQKNYLIDLAKYHKIEIVQSLSQLTKSEASRLIDKIILENGRMR